MVQVERRTQSEAERETLEKCLRRSLNRFGIAYGGLAIFTIAVLTLTALFSLVSRLPRLAFAAGVAFSLPIVAFAYLRSRSIAKQSAEPYRTDLDEGLVEVTRYRAREAIRVDEVEDEGNAYFILLEDEQVLFVVGQYLYAHEQDGRFPSTEFVVVRGPHSRVVHELTCLGSPLPTRRLSDLIKLGEAELPTDGALIEMDYFRTLVPQVTPP